MEFLLYKDILRGLTEGGSIQMNNSKGKYKSLIITAALIILMGGCNNSKINDKESSSVKSIINDKNSEAVSAIDKNERDESFKINSGLLIGLSKNNEIDTMVSPFKKVPNDYRTLWIHQENNKITYTEKKGEIITPYKDGFYKIGNNKFFMSDPSSNSDNQSDEDLDIIRNFKSYYNFSNIVSHPADKPMKNLFTPETFKKKYLDTKEGIVNAYKSHVEWLWYAGNNYACVKDFYYDTGGGTYDSGRHHIKLYDLENLVSLDGRENNVALADLLDENEKAKLQEYPKKYNKVISSEGMVNSEQIVDIKNLLLSRKDGKWQVLIPLYGVYQHNGNGSNGRVIEQYINTDIKLPKTITSHDDLCISWDRIKEKIPQAKDAVSSPNNDVLAVLTPTKLLIYPNPLNGINKPSLSIDVDSDERIILNQWSTGEYVDKWNKQINILPKPVKISLVF